MIARTTTFGVRCGFWVGPVRLRELRFEARSPRARVAYRGEYRRQIQLGEGLDLDHLEADLHDGKFTRNEATGVDLAINGLAEATPDDHELLERGMAIFEGLYTVLKQKT